jgi:hypothetical protein
MQTDFEKLSLRSVNIEGNVLGKFSTFAIEQEYTNTTGAVLAVTYTFPISASATVTGFTATVCNQWKTIIMKYQDWKKTLL